MLTCPLGAILLWVRIWVKRFSANSQIFSPNFLIPKMQEKVLKSYDFRTFYGCGGRTRTYDLRVMSCSQPNFSLQPKGFWRFLPPFSNQPGGYQSNSSWLVQSMMTPYGSAYGSRIRVRILGFVQPSIIPNGSSHQC